MPKRRPVIGIGADVIRDSSRSYAVPAHYVEAVELSGGMPLLIPPRVNSHRRSGR